MDSDEWEFLPDDGFHDFNEDGDKKIFSGKRNSGLETVFDMDYFLYPPPNSRQISEPPRNQRVPHQLVRVPIQLEPRVEKPPNCELVKENTKIPIEFSVVPSATAEKIKTCVEADQDTVSQVFFKTKENEFVDMKMDSPKSGSRKMLHQNDTASLKFEDRGEFMEMLIDSKWEANNSGFNLWEWSLTGIGAICSFGVAAAATICIMYFGSHQRNKLQQNQKIRFQVYSDDQRIKQAVQHATKLNELISPLTRAHVSSGGYYGDL